MISAPQFALMPRWRATQQQDSPLIPSLITMVVVCWREVSEWGRSSRGAPSRAELPELLADPG